MEVKGFGSFKEGKFIFLNVLESFSKERVELVYLIGY